MHIDEFTRLVMKRRSIRRLKSDPIPDEYITKILETARWAMSGANAQPWEFIVVKDQETKNKMADTFFETRHDIYIIEQSLIERLRQPKFVQPPVPPVFRDAPVLIVVLGDKRTLQATVLAANFMGGGEGVGNNYAQNLANASQIIHLAAAALELGSQWITVNHVWAQSLKNILGIPAMLDVHTVIPIGYRLYKPAPSYRRELKEIVHFDKYDQSRYRSSADVIEFISELRLKTAPAYRQAAPGA